MGWSMSNCDIFLGDRPLAYVRVPAREPEAASRFAEEILGLAPVGGEDRALRADARCQSLVFVSDARLPAVGIEMADERALDDRVERLRDAGCSGIALDASECRRRRLRQGTLVTMPSGYALELVVRVERSGQRFYPRRDSGVNGISAIGLRSKDIGRDTQLWTAALGAEIADRVGDITYLRLDGAHHRIALYPSQSSGLLYVSFGVETHDDLMRNSYFLNERQVRIVHGPGREMTSGRMFVRFIGPEGLVFSLDCEDTEQSASRQPRQFARDKFALCAWGSVCHDIPELSAA